MKLMYILPHCSTGGMPQYVLKQIEEFKSHLDISVIEVNNYGSAYVVQRDKIKKAVPFFQCNGNQDLLFKYIDEFGPDIVHFQELPESFIREATVAKIYESKYVNVVTTHSSLTRRRDFLLIPSNIFAVNNWQKELFEKEFKDDFTDISVWEYPIERKKPTKKQKGTARLELEHFSFHEPGKHILNVGLFTPGKNQGELFEIARKDPKNHYHFVGNQAPNFESYWGPLMQNRPNNCYVWGEQSDVETFYKAVDEFYFTSKFELNPIVIKEALSYGLPVKMRRLETYGTDYDHNPLVTFIK